MTLATLKSRLKVFTILLVAGSYGVGFYILGKSDAIENLIKVKGAKTENDSIIDSPLESPIPSLDNQSVNIVPSFVKFCSNTVYSFQISYSKDWFTTNNTDQEKCSFFAPYSFVVPQDTINFQVPIKVEVLESVDWDETVKFYQNPNDYQNVLSAQTIEVNGRPAQRIRAETTDKGSLPRGLLKLTYLIYDSNRPMAITYQQLKEDENTKQYEDISTQMAESLKFF